MPRKKPSILLVVPFGYCLFMSLKPLDCVYHSHTILTRTPISADSRWSNSVRTQRKSSTRARRSWELGAKVRVKSTRGYIVFSAKCHPKIQTNTLRAQSLSHIYQKHTLIVWFYRANTISLYSAVAHDGNVTSWCASLVVLYLSVDRSARAHFYTLCGIKIECANNNKKLCAHFVAGSARAG